MKYELTPEFIEIGGAKLYRIKALVSFNDVKAGETGGFIEKVENLAQDGDAWIYGNAWIYDNARVSDNACVYGDACVYGKLKLLSGSFFGVRYKKEEIKYVEVDEDYELIYKGEAKFGEEEPEKLNLSGKEVKVSLDGVEYTAVIK